MAEEIRRKRRRRGSGKHVRRWGCLLGLLAIVAALGLAATFILWQWTLIEHRFWTYPHNAEALARIEVSRHPRLREDSRQDLRGVFHSHTLLSHDSMIQPAAIVRAAKLAGIDFIFLTDHPAKPPKQVPPELNGEFEGVTLIPGVETSRGMLAWFFDTTSVDNEAKLADEITAVQEQGGVTAVCHPDEPRPWDDLPPFTAMEIYNLHADAKKSNFSITYRLSENFWSGPKYPMQMYHGLFRDPAEYLAIFDRLDQKRRIVAIAGNDAHQNNGLRLIVSANGTLLLTDTGPYKGKPLAEYKNWLAKHYAQGHATGETLWRWDIDLYERSLHFVNTHLLATGKSPAELRAALEAGHAYVAFDSLVTATGFDFFYRSDDGDWIMGDEATFSSSGVFTASMPAEGRLLLKRNGVIVAEEHGSELRYAPKQPGVYRVEGYLEVEGRMVPWIYSNPIYLR